MNLARKGQTRQLKRYAAPKVIGLERKSYEWVTKSTPGPHPSSFSVPMMLVIRDYLGLARTAREVKKILAQNQVLVDGRVRKDEGFSIGLMDVLQLPSINRNFRVLLDHLGRLTLHEIDQNEASFKLCKIVRKTTAKGKSVQLTFHDGKNMVGDPDELGKLKVKDVVKLSLPDLKILEIFPFEKGSIALITGGSNVGKIGRIVEIKEIEGSQPDIVTLKAGELSFQSPENYVFVLGKEAPAISLLKLDRGPSLNV
ncbi:MAG: hypothetical protein APU95_04710 [Hadesarchaea archaeon YNP_N21]|jgi:small subunit ribosomal protein S4e|nr:MAG: hypothetical protein APU95_04710 [Hadesarchaea archaeon YNP_N21]